MRPPVLVVQLDPYLALSPNWATHSPSCGEPLAGGNEELVVLAQVVGPMAEGRAMWSTEFAGFDVVPTNILKDVVMAIRKRKGLKLEMPRPTDYIDRI